MKGDLQKSDTQSCEDVNVLKINYYKYNAIPMKMHIRILIQLLEKPFGKSNKEEE